MLQSIDDDELKTLLPTFISQVLNQASTSTFCINLVDLGCGTGRNTAKLISCPWPKDYKISITALDFSAGMLDVAAKKIDALPLNDTKRFANPMTRLEQCDCFPTVYNSTASPLPTVTGLEPAQAVISTLVLEHIPLTDYFSTLACLLVKGGYALVTNMHSEMGKMSQAGFVNEQGVKVRGKSFAHTVEETREEARRAGFEMLQCRERKVQKQDLVNGVVGERGGKWVGVKVWYGLLLRKIV
jgi:predicted TPR repeat methyltransferase